jgi:hypothetical protein
MHRSALIAAICMSLPVQTAVCQEAFQVTNITIKMIKHGGRGNFRIDAEIANPNDFAVFDLRVACKIRDRRGKELVSYGSTLRRYPGKGSQNCPTPRHRGMAGSRENCLLSIVGSETVAE